MSKPDKNGNVTEIVISKDVTVVVHDDALEPHEYFQAIKSTSANMDHEIFDTQLDYIAKQITNAKRVGQKNFVNWLTFVKRSLLRESMLMSLGISQYVHRDALVKLIKYVEPKGSVKIIELARYPRVIPDNIIERLETIKSLELFDDYIVVFTDLTDNTYRTKEELEFVRNNTDPIVFGIFKEDETSEQYERLYLIADWEDETCNLKFNDMIKHFTTIKKINTNPTGTLYPETISMTPKLMVRKHKLSFTRLMRKIWPWSKI